MDATKRHPSTFPYLLLLTVAVMLTAIWEIIREGVGEEGEGGVWRRSLPQLLLLAPLAVQPSTTPRALALSLAFLPAVTADAIENCVVCGSNPTTRCPCGGCDSGGGVDCSFHGIKSLFSGPIVLPEGTTSLCVRVDPPLHSFLAVQGRNWHAATLTHPSCPLVIGRSLSLSAAASHPSCLLLPARILWSGSGCVVASGPGPASVQKESQQQRPLRAPCRDL